MVNLFTNHKILLATRVVFLRAHVRSRLTYNRQNWTLTAEQFRKLDGFSEKNDKSWFERQSEESDESFKYRYRNSKVLEICKPDDVSKFIRKQQQNYAAHLVRTDNSCSTKELMLQEDRCIQRGRNTNTLLKQVLKNENVSRSEFMRACTRQF